MKQLTKIELGAFMREHFIPVPEADIVFHAGCKDRPCPHFTRDVQDCLREVPDSD